MGMLILGIQGQIKPIESLKLLTILRRLAFIFNKKLDNRH